jgi:hypothetical protein
MTCRRLGAAGGNLVCTGDCRLDTSVCAVCGNGEIEAGESCDGANVGGETCTSLGLGAGTAACDPLTCHFDTSGCEVGAPRCGNGVIEPGEDCDGVELADLDCGGLGFGAGELRCAPTCRFDTSACQALRPSESCGECRARRCRAAEQACDADRACADVLACLVECDDYASRNLCSIQCAEDTGAGAGIFLSLSVLACVNTVCADACGGAP